MHSLERYYASYFHGVTIEIQRTTLKKRNDLSKENKVDNYPVCIREISTKGKKINKNNKVISATLFILIEENKEIKFELRHIFYFI
jgi:hypothetical protein